MILPPRRPHRAIPKRYPETCIAVHAPDQSDDPRGTEDASRWHPRTVVTTHGIHPDRTVSRSRCTRGAIAMAPRCDRDTPRDPSQRPHRSIALPPRCYRDGTHAPSSWSLGCIAVTPGIGSGDTHPPSRRHPRSLATAPRLRSAHLLQRDGLVRAIESERPMIPPPMMIASQAFTARL